jgi:hypothetical protein
VAQEPRMVCARHAIDDTANTMENRKRAPSTMGD